MLDMFLNFSFLFLRKIKNLLYQKQTLSMALSLLLSWFSITTIEDRIDASFGNEMMVNSVIYVYILNFFFNKLITFEIFIILTKKLYRFFCVA